MDIGEFKYSLRVADRIIHNRVESGRWSKSYGNSIRLALQSFKTFMEPKLEQFDSMVTITYEWVTRAKDRNESLNNYRVVGKLMESVDDCLLAVDEVDDE